MPTTTRPASRPSHKKALALLGVAASLAYFTPVITPLGEAQASGMLTFFINDAVTLKECGACHQAYDAGLMPQGSWRRIMGDLQNHFGDDATLDEPTRLHIENYLVSHAARGDGPLRITEQPWFLSQHTGGFSFFSFFSDEKPTALANCDACHGGG